MSSRHAVQDYEYKGMFATSKSWVTAVTYVEISESVYGTVFLSIGLAAAVVFVFSGFRMMIFAAITVLMINVTVMGVLYTWGWTLGAVEGMSITSLVGLSVDFCIHIAEAHVHARTPWRPTDATAKLQAGCTTWLCNPNPLGKFRARCAPGAPAECSAAKPWLSMAVPQSWILLSFSIQRGGSDLQGDGAVASHGSHLCLAVCIG